MEALPQDVKTLREWAPLTSLLSQIPRKAQRGLFTGDLNLTCVSALPEFLAIGTNHGLVYWYDRSTHELQRLRCENTMCSITCVEAISSVDYMIAAGADNGTVSVFLVPKKLPDDIPEIFKANSKRQVERYTVGGLHTAPISAIEWSTNGMKLFSGDQKGLLVVTEIDFYMHLSKSVEVLNEKYEVIQLSYNSSQQLLLVSTLYRTILCNRSEADNIWKVTQVGNKERRTLGRMGATFSNSLENPRCPIAYCSRPGLRLWISNKEGVVEKTLIYKEAVVSQHNHIQLLNPTRSRVRFSRGEPVFGPLLYFMEQYLVTYSADSLLILDPQTISVVAALYDVQKISALCVSKSEIFILEGERHLLRLGLAPESCGPSPQEDSAKGIPIASQLLELTSKLRDSSIISALPIKKFSPIFSPTKSSGSSDGEHVSECMEAQELPPVLSLDCLDSQTAESVPELTLSGAAPSFKEIYARPHCSTEVPLTGGSLNPKLLDKIDQEQYEDVVFQPKRKQKKSKVKHIVTGTESGSDTTSIWSSTSETDELLPNDRMDVSSGWSTISVGGASRPTTRRSSSEETQREVVDCLPNETGTSATRICELPYAKDNEAIWEENFHKSCTNQLPLSQDLERPTMLPLPSSLNADLCGHDSFQQALAAKEQILAKKYNLESVLGFSTDQNNDIEIKYDVENLDSDKDVAVLCNKGELSENAEDKITVGSVQQMNSLDSIKTITDEDNAHLSIQEDKMTSLSSTLSYGPPSDSSQPPSHQLSLELETIEDTENESSSAACRNAMVASGWLQYSAPQPVTTFAVCSNYIVTIDSQAAVHYSGLSGLGLKWQHADCKANRICISPNAEHVWRTHENTVYALKRPSPIGPHGEHWVIAGENIRSVALGNNVAWVVSQDGDVLCHKSLTAENPVTTAVRLENPCEWQALKIAYFSNVLWLLSTTGEVYTRLGVSSVNPEGISWKRVNIPVPGTILDIALGAQRTGWIIDDNNVIMFSVDHMEPEPHWWQVLISDYIFQHTSPLQQLRSKMTLKNLCSTLPGRQIPSSSVVSGRDSVWIVQLSSCTMHTNKTSITGHCWNRVRLRGPNANIRWQTVTAEGVFENGGQLWLQSVDGDLFCLSPCIDKNISKDCLQKIPLPSDRGAVCLAAASQALWLLTSTGQIYIRQGLSDTCFHGNDWRELSLVQIEGVHLTHVSCGCDTVWACDTAGNMYMAISSPHAMATSTFSPAWIYVGDANKEQKKIFFIKVFVGSQTSMVWALDKKGKIYVREAIFPDFQLGLDWVVVSGITALDLSISNSAVWALSTDGAVYQRHGITQNNYIGDYWKKIPGSVEALSASICDSLWGIDKNGYLLRHGRLTVHLSPSSGTPLLSKHLSTVSGDDGDWEVIG